MAKIAVLTCVIIGLVMTPNTESASEGSLVVTAKYAENLVDRDNVWARLSDPYMEVVAVNDRGDTLRRITRTVSNNHNPIWNQVMDFGRSTWIEILVRVYDDDGSQRDDDELSDENRIYLPDVGFNEVMFLPCYSNGIAVIDVAFN